MPPRFPDTLRPLSLRLALRCLGLSVLIWGLLGVALGLGSWFDQLRRGQPAVVVEVIARMLPFFTSQVLFSAGFGLLLACRPGVLDRPWRLGLAALASLPLQLGMALPLNGAVRTLIAGDGAEGWRRRLGDWSGTQLWVDLMIAGAAMLAQAAWVVWRRSQAREAAWRAAEADNLSLRLSLLQGQLEPHFLFNTLNGIAALVRGAERAVALQALSRLSELLRYALRASQQRWVSLADELRFIEDYVALQRLRFGDALQWQADVDAGDWARMACPPLLLQPLVENAIRHGLEAGGSGALRLCLQRRADGVRVLIDNACPADAAPQPGHGLGLAKTREWLAALYAGRARLEAAVDAGRFHLTLELPFEDLDAALESPDRR
ncbi:MAG: sensor histidine kinase [Roseateles sp.]